MGVEVTVVVSGDHRGARLRQALAMPDVEPKDNRGDRPDHHPKEKQPQEADQHQE